MKTLQIVETAYRATLEEQDDTILWLTASMRNAGAELSVLLAGNAVNYAVAAQQPVALQIGAWRQKQPPNPAADLAALAAKGVELFALAEDLELRGIDAGALAPQVTPMPRAQLPALFAQHARVWRW